MNFWDDDKPKKTEHRAGPDLLIRFTQLSSVLIWIMIGIMLVFTDSAKPEIYTILDIHYDKSSRISWNQNILTAMLIFSIIIFALSLISLIVNSQRLKRKTDHIRYSLVIGLIVSTIAMVALFVNYLGAL